MLLAAARALAEASPSKHDPNANVLPPITELRDVSYRVALALALQAQRDGHAEETSREELEARIRLKMWTPTSRPYRRTFR
jgi:malate dehydrogenase (oxaloacetate-decarboxylating)